ncbi:MAG: acylneuraminate cytidylyltransferase family protein [Bdellovibrionales bacterium]|nr:acylneuraminate cytidylyltransferase family protein [Bdellovibrionales bacterium]
MKIAIVPARGGSKRIPRKNIIDFHGEPMLVKTIKSLSESGLFDKIHVSTDSEEVFEVAANAGFRPEFLRENSLADDFTPVFEVVNWVVKKFEESQPISEIALVMPCSPLINCGDYKKAYLDWESSGRRYPLMSVSKYPCPVEWSFSPEGDGSIVADNPKALSTRSQDLKERFFDTGNFYFLNRKQLNDLNEATFTRYIPFVLPWYKAVDIDDQDGLEFAKKLYKINQIQ